MGTPEEPSPRRPDHRDTQRSKQEVLRVLRRAGYPEETIRQIEETFPDPIDIERDAAALAEYGVTMGALADRFGASP